MIIFQQCSFRPHPFSLCPLQKPFWYCRELIFAIIWEERIGDVRTLEYGILTVTRKLRDKLIFPNVPPAPTGAWPHTGGSCSCRSTGAPPSPTTQAWRLCRSCGKQGEPVLLICCTITWCSSWLWGRTHCREPTQVCGQGRCWGGVGQPGRRGALNFCVWLYGQKQTKRLTFAFRDTWLSFTVR